MSTAAEIQKVRAEAYRAVTGVPQWREVHLDLLRWAGLAEDATVRCGRYEIIARLVRAGEEPNG